MTETGGEDGKGGGARPARRRIGRPKLAPGERLTDGFRVRLTTAERAAIMAQAARAGLTPSEFARRALTGARIIERGHSGPSRIPPALLTELVRIGNNLNQVAHAAHLGRPLTGMAAETLTQLQRLLDAIAARLDDDA